MNRNSVRQPIATGIPAHLLSRHLFLLVGANPLPDWVAAKLLLEPGGQLYLIHSEGTRDVAQELAAFFVPMGNNPAPIYVPITDESNPALVYSTIHRLASQLTPKHGQVGLNYTGGTKVMAVHAYRAIMDCYRDQHITAPMCSYLDGRALHMVFDGQSNSPATRFYDIGLLEQACIDLNQLFALHREKLACPPRRDALALPIIETIIGVHQSKSDAGFKMYRRWCNDQLQTTLKNYKPRMSESDLQKLREQANRIRIDTLMGYPGLHPVAVAITHELSAADATLGDVAKGWGFEGDGAALEMVRFLDGGWLEHYALHAFKQYLERNKALAPYFDYGRNILMGAGPVPSMEVDVAIIRCYQLFLVSCFSGLYADGVKDHLFEAWLRARELGGDEARVVLVCCDENPLRVEQQIAQRWRTGNRLKVFGRNDLAGLSETLGEWISKWK
jgi:hypothetical protein